NMHLPPIQELGVFEDDPSLYRQSKYHSVEKLDGFINKFTNKLRYTHPTRYPTSSKKYNGYKATLSALPDIRFY
ncbi:7173_t:CDS:1, partial [Funneliformis caledonium]